MRTPTSRGFVRARQSVFFFAATALVSQVAFAECYVAQVMRKASDRPAERCPLRKNFVRAPLNKIDASSVCAQIQNSKVRVQPFAAAGLLIFDPPKLAHHMMKLEYCTTGSARTQPNSCEAAAEAALSSAPNAAPAQDSTGVYAALGIHSQREGSEPLIAPELTWDAARELYCWEEWRVTSVTPVAQIAPNPLAQTDAISNRAASPILKPEALKAQKIADIQRAPAAKTPTITIKRGK